MVESNRAEKLVELEPSLHVLSEGKALIPQDSPALVVSVIGAMSSGKSTLMNTLVGHKVFHVEDDVANACKNTTEGIDIYESSGQIYLDCEGAFNQEGDGDKIIQMAAFVSCFSDTILILVRKEECHSENSVKSC